MAHRASAPHALRRLLLTLPLLALLTGCAQLFAPLENIKSVSGDTEESGTGLVRVVTCWAALPLAEDLAAAYARENTQVSVDVTATESQIARDLLAAGQADVAIVVQEPSDEGGSAWDTRSTSSTRIIALDAVGIIVHKDSPLENLTTEQLAALLNGEVLDWRDLDAGEGPIEVLIQQDPASMDTVLSLTAQVDTPEPTTAIVMPHDRGVVEYVAEHPGAIGLASTAYVDERVKLVALDDLLPTTNNVRRGRYPLTQTLEVLTATRAERHASQFVAYALGTRGRRIVQRDYQLPR
ncbi:MAG: substrate-binding domain-containing protein [Anaerolineae bacterium]